MKEDDIETGSWKAWVLAARPKTLTGAAVPVMIGLSLAWHQMPTALSAHVGTHVLVSVLCLLFAFIMQIDANFINDYFDFMKGNDDETRLGPKRACAMGWIHAHQMRKAILLVTVLACLVGLPLVFFGGWSMVLVGLLCVLFCFLYTTHLSYLGLGDVLVLLFFGVVPVCIPYYIIRGDVSFTVVMASVACGLVIDTLLMINNYRDIDNDTRAGKRTLCVRVGKSRSRLIYLLLGIVACAIGVVFLANGYLWAFVLPFVYLAIHVRTYFHMVEIDHGRELNIILGETARNMFIYGLLVSIGILIS
ncbi:MAG: 1,4-dihydroxy-2-naphthoate octaprenyltransferase [Prevotella sp.]|nr:1,4-dihydroxy-2-naphthoate octaprenyltransferase [Prevotella sp.]